MIIKNRTRVLPTSFSLKTYHRYCRIRFFVAYGIRHGRNLVEVNEHLENVKADVSERMRLVAKGAGREYRYEILTEVEEMGSIFRGYCSSLDFTTAN